MRNAGYFRNDNRLVEQVSWDDVQEFLKRPGNRYRLPAEAEWEYAARGGTTTRYSFGDNDSQLGVYAWFYGNARLNTHPVGKKQPNPFGLYDMHGNVWEWCGDTWHGNYQGAPADGSAWLSDGHAGLRVLRGGSWYNDSTHCTSGNRFKEGHDFRFFNTGFRVAASLPGNP